MGGFQHILFVTPVKVEKLEIALREFWLWQKTTKTWIDEDGYDWLKITRYSIKKSLEDSIFYNEDGTPWEPYKLKYILSTDEKKGIKSGKWMIYWHEISWPWKWSIQILEQLTKACKNNDCLWFVENIIATSDRLGELFQNIHKNLAEELGGEYTEVGVHKNDKWR